MSNLILQSTYILQQTFPFIHLFCRDGQKGYHIWEFVDGDTWGVETNVYHAGKSEDITGDYEKEISELILSWPDMAIPG